MTSTPFAAVRLAAGDSHLILVPEAGGAVAAWRVGDQPMLHESGAAAGPGWDPLAMACFPLVPYSNRIAGGTFTWGGRVQCLPCNAPPIQHPLHGVGWQAAWQVVEQGASHATLHHDHPGGADWPWPYRAEQRFVVTQGGLAVDLAVTNLDDGPVPLAIGLHPYFDSAGAGLKFDATMIWRTDRDVLPTTSEPPHGTADFSASRPVADGVLDNGYDGWDGDAEIRWDGRPLRLRIRSDLPCAVVYTPADAGYFCFEPVPHSSNALNLVSAGRPMPVAGPGGRIEARVEFQAFAGS